MSQFTVSERPFSFSGKRDLALDAESIQQIKDQSQPNINPLRTIVELVCSMFGVKFEAASKDLFTLTHSKNKYDCDQAMNSLNSQLGEGASGRVQCKEIQENNKTFYQYSLVIDGQDPILLDQVEPPKLLSCVPNIHSLNIRYRLIAIKDHLKGQFEHSKAANEQLELLMTKKWASERELDTYLSYLNRECQSHDVNFYKVSVNDSIEYRMRLADGQEALLRHFEPHAPISKRHNRIQNLVSAEDRRDYARIQAAMNKIK
ncbi:hypothetical protein D5R81_01495 [Parashewanella spongiae]|uniref:Uncharacterized protein n=1 Tax=Parashewanella spongiae TaxID=342950 RepID=A0A3A6U1L1_9GAMM|nr:hypothetical protein [Parashewanella spongiae]MCL1076779.1 hypothetical protein [Parashewanella spongiae]RJY19296.1 hypothetical protein D5R81_01495 [Parashewanella spongiae]